MKWTILIALSLLLVSTAFATERWVPSQYATIQRAIDAASNGDVVIVAPGIYTGHGNCYIDFEGKAITVRSKNGPGNCIIDCENHGCGFYFHSGEDGNSVINGFTITNGSSYEGGGGIYCLDSSPTIINCIISGNRSRSDGGGICCERFSNPVIVNCTINGNSAGECGGGIYCDEDSKPTITNCIIMGNTAQDDGGGIYCKYDSKPTITNCMISSNQAINGGGMYCDDSSSMITSCTFSGNSASDSGGGIYCWSRTTLTNCILWGNTDSGGMGESAQILCRRPEVRFSCVQDDDPNDAYIPFDDANNYNIDDDPMFVRNPNDGGDGWGVGDNDDFGDLHLRNSSPCINAGVPHFIAGPNNVDIDGQPRVIGCRVDMGADEFAPMIVVTKPQGGEVWVSGSIHKIKWSSYGVGDVNILLDDGNGWRTIENNATNTGSYVWHLPDIVDSNRCLVSVVPSAPDANVICIESGLFTIHPDSPDPAVTSKWKSLGGDFRRAGLSTNYGPELGCVKWQFETDGPVYTGVTIGADDQVHIACEDGKVYTVDPNGMLLWSYDVNSPLISSPTVGGDGTIYVGCQNGRVYAIDKGGQLRWTHNTEGMIYSSVAVADNGKVFIGSQDGTVYTLGPDGSKLWSFTISASSPVTPAILASPTVGADGTVYVGGLYNPVLYALNPETGEVNWSCDFEHPAEPCQPELLSVIGSVFASPVVGDDGTIYISLLHDANLYAVEPNSGNIIWAADMADADSGWFEPNYVENYAGTSCWSEPVLGPDGTIYVSFDDPYLRAVNPDGGIKWVVRLGMMGGFTMTAGNDGLIYAASDDGSLYVVKPDGEEVARFDSSDWLAYPVIADDGTIYVSDANNTVWAISQDGCEGKPGRLNRLSDLNGDRIVDILDFAVLAGDWLECTGEVMWCYGEVLYLIGDVNRDLHVDFFDLAAVAAEWLCED